MLKIPAFGEKKCIENQENKTAKVYVFSNAEESAFSAYCSLLEQEGYVKKESFERENHKYAAFSNAANAVFINDYASIKELYIVTEENCNYFSYTDTVLDKSVSPQIRQVHLEDFGMAYACRLSDGRFILFDGGRGFDAELDALFACLSEGSVYEKPVIAAWVFTHPHADHFRCFLPFVDAYKDRVVIEKLLFNFPRGDDLEHYPAQQNTDKRIPGFISNVEMIPMLHKRIGELGIPAYMTHTGQTYQIGDAKCEILASMDDTMHVTDNLNATSVLMRMELGGQVILWAADGSFEYAKLPEKHGAYLKSDILQVPHHGFSCGSAEAEIRGYEIIKPQVALMPVSDYNAFTAFCSFKESAEYLMKDAGIRELITGDGKSVIPLPYTAPDYAQKELERKFLAGKDSCGSCTWVFSGLSTANEADFVFTILNMTNRTATVSIDLFFADSARNIRYIKAEIQAGTVSEINIIGDEVDGDAVYFNWMCLKKLGIPENMPFAARFLSDTQIVITHKTHQVSYVGENR